MGLDDVLRSRVVALASLDQSNSRLIARPVLRARLICFRGLAHSGIIKFMTASPPSSQPELTGFAAGTLIDSPLGTVPIEEIQAGALIRRQSALPRRARWRLDMHNVPLS